MSGRPLHAIDSVLIPTGELTDVTTFSDFRKPTPIESRLDEKMPCLTTAGAMTIIRSEPHDSLRSQIGCLGP